MRVIMIRAAINNLLILLVTIPLSLSLCLADEAQSPATEDVRPELVNCEVSDVSFQIDGSKLWTLSGIRYKSKLIATSDSAYGTALNIDGVGLLGTAHFLDVPGQPGKIEKENVTELQFFLNGSRVNPASPRTNFNGQSFRLKRRSEIRTVRLESELRLENEVLLETVRLQTEQAVRLKLCYPLMYAWSPTMTDYLFGDDNGIQKQGSFLPEGAHPGEGLERAARWMAVYDSVNQCGAVCLLCLRPESENVWFQYTDAPGVYRKLRLMSFSEKNMPANFDGTFQSALGFFHAEPSVWEDAAIHCLENLRSVAINKEEDSRLPLR